MRRSIFPVMALLILSGCSSPPPPPAPPEPPLVTVEKVQERELDSYLEFTGYLKAPESQSVRAQVTGYLQKVNFKDGDEVPEGKVLYEIDPEPYEAALKNAEAGVVKAQADIVNAESALSRAKTEFERAEKLYGTRAIGVEEFESKRTTRDGAIADLGSKNALKLAADATLKKAVFDRNNCTIKSLVKGIGRVAKTEVTPGNLITSGTTLLTTVTSVDPVYAYFDVDEMTSLIYRQKVDRKEIADPRQEATRLKCWIALKNETGYPHAGQVAYIAPEINRGTNTREIYGIFDNKPINGKPRLFSPGDSVRVKVELGGAKQYVTIPEIAVGSRQQQKYVFVVVKDKDGKSVAEFRPVTLGAIRQVGAARLVIVEQGLKAGETVVVNGLLNVRPGAELRTKEQTPIAGGAQ